MDKANRSRAIRLHKDMDVLSAMRCVVSECLRQLQENLQGITTSNEVECVHQARVALRRLRSVDKAFKTLSVNGDWPTLMQEAQWLAKPLGDLRDLQILSSTILPKVAEAHANTIDFSTLQKQLTRRSERARIKLLTALQSKRSHEFLRRLQAWLDNEDEKPRNNLQDFAKKSLSKRWKKVNSIVVHWENLNQDQRHALRKSAKKLRYSIEVFSSLFAKKSTAKYVKYLERVQKSLGNLNDIATAAALLGPLIKPKSTKTAVNASLQWLTHEEQKHHATATKLLAKWHHHPPFWR